MEKLKVVVTTEDYNRAMEQATEPKDWTAYTEPSICPGSQMIRRVMQIPPEHRVDYGFGSANVFDEKNKIIASYNHKPAFCSPHFKELAAGIEHHGTLIKTR